MKVCRGSVSWFGWALLSCTAAAGATPATPPLTPENRLAIVRLFSYEYATALQPLPASKKITEALEIDPAGQVNEEKLRQTLINRGVAVQTGELVQITEVSIKPRNIILEINGGGKQKKKKWYQRIQIQVGAGPVGGPTVERTPPAPPPGSAAMPVGAGSWIALAFPEGVPDLTPEELKQQLAGVLDFTYRSAAVPWIETIPEEFRQAIEEGRVMVGMDRDMVLAAKGRPDRKVRETKNGRETEEWIYGHPPFVTFVVFEDDTVVEIKEFK